MATFFNPQGEGGGRLFAPATQRNRDAIAAALKDLLPPTGTLLEIASGTGEHAAHIAPQLDGWRWIASDIDAAHIASIDAWNAHTGAGLEPAALLDVGQLPWPVTPPVDAIFTANLLHIAPAEISAQLMQGAAQILAQAGVLLVYGPFMVGGAHVSPSNADFDAKLRANNPAWGVRDTLWLDGLARDAGLMLSARTAMPANNFILSFVREP